MFSAFLPLFKRSHADSSSEPADTSIDRLRESVAEVMQTLVSDPSAMQGLKAEMLSDTSSWTDPTALGDRPAKYEAFAARITRIGATTAAADEFTLTAPVVSDTANETTGTNSFAAFAARVPESVRNAVAEMHANKPSALHAAQAAGEPTPPIEPPRRTPSTWDIPPLR